MKDFKAGDPTEQMPHSAGPVADDTLIRYLLGALPETDTERLDERSVADDEFTARLRQVEDDLVDSYASGTLTGELLARFESSYLASPRRQAKTDFARRLLTLVDGEPRPRVLTVARTLPASARRGWVPWALAAAAAMLLVTVGALLIQEAGLRRQLVDANVEAGALRERADAAIEQRDELARASAKPAPPAPREPVASVGIALLLLPQTRGVGPVPIVAVPSGVRTIALDLQIDGAGSASYEVALKDPASNAIVWRSPPLGAAKGRERPAVAVALPAALLKTQHYAIDLFARASGGISELTGTYAFEVVRR